MKKLTIIIILITYAIIANALSEEIAGEWLMIKAEIGDKIEEGFIIMDFRNDGKMETMGMEVGTWKFSKVDNKIVLNSQFDKDFNGDAIILKLTQKEMILDKNGAKLFYMRINSEEIAETNKKSNLQGVWRIENTESETTFLKFMSPDSFLIVDVSNGSTEKTRGTWIYNPKEETIIIIGFSQFLKGKSKIIKHTANELVLESREKIIKATKEDEDSNKIERLSFEYEDFPETDDDIGNLPWNNFEEMLCFLKNVEHLKYSYGNLINELNSFKYSIILSEIKVNTEKQNVMFTNLHITENDTMQFSQNYKGGLSERYNDFFPKNDLSFFKVIGIEKITIAAGTFDCTVVEGIDGDEKLKYWMINHKPGVYAKIIKEGISVFDEGEYTVKELIEIK